MRVSLLKDHVQRGGSVTAGPEGWADRAESSGTSARGVEGEGSCLLSDPFPKDTRDAGGVEHWLGVSLCWLVCLQT